MCLLVCPFGIFSHFIIVCHLLKQFVRFCQSVSHVIPFCHILLAFVIFCHFLSLYVTVCHILYKVTKASKVTKITKVYKWSKVTNVIKWYVLFAYNLIYNVVVCLPIIWYTMLLFINEVILVCQLMTNFGVPFWYYVTCISIFQDIFLNMYHD